MAAQGTELSVWNSGTDTPLTSVTTALTTQPLSDIGIIIAAITLAIFYFYFYFFCLFLIKDWEGKKGRGGGGGWEETEPSEKLSKTALVESFLNVTMERANFCRSFVAAGKNIKWFRYFLVLGIIMHSRNWYHPSDSLLLLLLFGVHPHPFLFLRRVPADVSLRRKDFPPLRSHLFVFHLIRPFHCSTDAPHSSSSSTQTARCRANKTPPQLPTRPKTLLPGKLALPVKFYVTLSILRFQGLTATSARSEWVKGTECL